MNSPVFLTSKEINNYLQLADLHYTSEYVLVSPLELQRIILSLKTDREQLKRVKHLLQEALEINESLIKSIIDVLVTFS